MFKLNNANGNFDIVFSEELSPARREVFDASHGTSASRRRLNHAKSKVLPKFSKKKEEKPGGFKTTKTNELRMKKLEQSKKAALKQPEAKKESSSEEIKSEPVEQSARSQTRLISKSSPMSSPRSPASSQKSSPRTPTISNKSSPRPDSISSKSSPRPDSISSKKSFRSNTGLAKQVSSDEPKETDDEVSYRASNDTGVISATELTSMFEDFFPKSNPPADEGLNNSENNAQKEPIISPREKEIKERQKTPEVKYNPWGKPGAGAPMNDSKQNRRQRDNGSSKSSSKSTSPRSVNSTSPRRIVNSHSTEVSPRFSDEEERRREKHLHHLKAIEEQVEEKRRLRRIETEKREAEERRAEEKFLQEQKMIEERRMEEDRKEREKLEAKKRKEGLIAESLKCAEVEAQKVKKSKTKKKKSKESLEVEAMRNDYESQPSYTEAPLDYEGAPVDYEEAPVDYEEAPVESDLYFLPNISSDRQPSDAISPDIEDFEALQRRNRLLEMDLELADEFEMASQRSQAKSPQQRKDKRDWQNKVDRNKKQRDDFSHFENLTASTSPTPRQQQILDQLQLLRQGLQEKKREYSDNTF